MTAVLSNQEIEQALLGAVLCDHRVLAQIIALSAEDFAFSNHQLIWSAIARINEAGEIVNPVSVCKLLAARVEEVGGARYVAQLASAPLGTLAAPHWARELRDLSAKRRLVQIAAETKERAEGDSEVSAEELGADVLRDVEGILSHAAPRVRDIRDVVLTEAATMSQPLECYSTGIDCLNLAMGGGMYVRRAYGIAARKKAGKTLLAGGISRALNRAGIRHLYIAGEMGSDQIEHRNMARDLECNALAFIDPKWRRDVAFQRRVIAHATAMPNNTLYLDAPGITFDQLRRDVTNTILTHKIKGFILDYLQLVGGQRRGQSKAEHLDEVSQWIAETCKKRNVFALVLAQINQEGNTRGGEGIRLAFDQVYELKRAEAGDGAWLEMLDTRYTKYYKIGDAEKPAFFIEPKIGPYFREANLTPEDQAA
jgi:replicative DNA helicase